MIIIYLGGVGSGKTLSIIREIIRKNQFTITNFKLKNYKNYHRLKFSDIIEEIEHKNWEGKKKGTKKKVNWDFWDKIRKNHKEFSIYLDEIHNIIHSRSAMSTTNKLMSQWVSQIRKITSDSDKNHLYIISQKMRKIDVDFRELAHIIVECSKINRNGKTYIVHTYYQGIEGYERKKRLARKYFIGNKFFKYYDSTEMVTFSDAEEFI